MKQIPIAIITLIMLALTACNDTTAIKASATLLPTQIVVTEPTATATTIPAVATVMAKPTNLPSTATTLPPAPTQQQINDAWLAIKQEVANVVVEDMEDGQSYDHVFAHYSADILVNQCIETSTVTDCKVARDALILVVAQREHMELYWQDQVQQTVNIIVHMDLHFLPSIESGNTQAVEEAISYINTHFYYIFDSGEWNLFKYEPSVNVIDPNITYGRTSWESCLNELNPNLYENRCHGYKVEELKAEVQAFYWLSESYDFKQY